MTTIYSIAPGSSTVVENDFQTSITFTITRSGDLPAATVYAGTVSGTVDFADNDQDIGDNVDFDDILDQPLVFAADETQKTVTVFIHGDDLLEGDERFALVVQASQSDPLSTFLARATFTVYDDDGDQQEVPYVTWHGGSGDWTDVTNDPEGGLGWYDSLPGAGVDAEVGGIGSGNTLTYSLGGGGARALKMQDNINSLANAGTFEMTGGSLTLSTASRIGNFVQTGGTITFRNGVVRPDNTIDFDHPDSAGAISDIGLLATQGTGGTIVIESGVLALTANGNSLAGTISGDGQLVIGQLPPFPASTTLEAGVNLTVAAVRVDGATAILGGDLSYAGRFELAPSGVIAASGHVLTLTGAPILVGTFDGGNAARSKALVAGAASVGGFTVKNGMVVEFQDVVTVDQNFFGTTNVGTGGLLKIAADATWNFVNDVHAIALDSTGQVDNAGTLAKAFGTETNSIFGAGTFTSTGTIRVDTGKLIISTGTATIAGEVTGAGALQLGADGASYTIAADTTIDIAQLTFTGFNASAVLEGDLSYGGSFIGVASNAGVALNGFTFTLSGTAALSGHYGDEGTLAVTGTATVNAFAMEGTAVLENAGAITALGNTNLNAGSTLSIDSEGSWTFGNNQAVTLQSGAHMENAGLLQKTAGTGQNTISGGTFDNTGTISVQTGTLAIQGGTGTIGGHLTGDGTLFIGGGTYTLAAGTTVDVANLSFGGGSVHPSLGGDLSYAGTFTASGELGLGGHKLTLSGTSALNGLGLNGGGTLLATGQATVISLTLDDAATFEARDTVTLATPTGGLFANEGAFVKIGEGAVWTFAGSSQYGLQIRPGAQVENAGLLEKTGTGSAQVSGVSGGTFVNTGIVTAASGTLQLNSSLTITNSSTMEARGGGTLSFDGFFGFNPDTNAFAYSLNLNNNGVIEAAGGTVSLDELNVTGTGHVSISGGGMLTTDDTFDQDIVFDGTGRIVFRDFAGYGGHISGFGTGSSIDFTAVDFEDVVGFTYDGTTLAIDLEGSSTPLTYALSGSVTEANLQFVDNGQGDARLVVAAAGSATLTTGPDTVSFVSGTNTVNATAATFNAGDSLTGGSGTDVLALTGGGTFNLGAIAHFSGFEQVKLDNNNYSIVVGNANVAAGKVLTINGATIAAGRALVFNGAAEADGAFAVTGGAGNDALTSGAGADTLNGGAGNDTLNGGLGNDLMRGGAGNDDYTVNAVGDTVDEQIAGGTGIDTVRSSVGFSLVASARVLGIFESLVLTGAAAINGTGNTGANTLTGNGAANVLNGAGGADTLIGGLGNDVYLTDGGDVINEATNAGSDTVQSTVTLALGANLENLTLTGAAAINGTGNGLNNVLRGNGAANILNGAGGADTLIGGLGNDTYLTDGGDTISEASNAGTDTVQSSVSLTLGANLENLTLTGVAAINGTGNGLNNVLRGNGAANVLNGDAGIDTLVGGLGNDTYVTDGRDAISEAANQGTDTVQSSATFTLGANLENLTLTGAAAINGTGNGLNNVLTGNAAANLLNGATGADRLQGGAGNDTYVTDGGDTIIEAAGQGTDTVRSSATYTLAANLENLVLTGAGAINGTGNALDNTITGNAEANVLIGGLGNDVLTGGAGLDRLQGGAGNDTYIVGDILKIVVEAADQGTDTVRSSAIHTLGANVENLVLTGAAAISGGGNALANTIIGNAATNLLDGGLGNDVLTGGAGRDSFRFNTTLGATNVDRITDFDVAQDTIWLGIMVFGGIGVEPRTLPAVQFWKSTAGVAHDADDRVIYDIDSGRLFYDANGNAAGGAVQFATVGAHLALTNADFAVVI